jgi:alpha-glucosidase
MKITLIVLQRSLIMALFMIFISSASLCSAPIELKSPNGELKISVELNNKIVYNISYGQDDLLSNCSMQLDLQSQSLGEQPKLKSKKFSTINEAIIPSIPLKNATVKNNCNVLLLNFKDDFSIEFRAYDDGAAYRFITHKKGDAIVLGEDFEIQFPATYLSHLSFTGSFGSAYEEAYSHVNTNEYKQSDRMTTLPILLETNKQYKILISEADLLDYPCMSRLRLIPFSDI